MNSEAPCTCLDGSVLVLLISPADRGPRQCMSTSDETTLLLVLRARQYRVDDRARLESLSLLTLLPGPCTMKAGFGTFL